jgi:integrase
MQDPKDPIPQASRREPWNKGKLTGAKPPLRPKHVWSIRSKLQIEGRTRDLAMFNLAIDSKLRGCDVVRLKVEDVAPHGHAVDRATVRQKKTGQPVRFEMTEQTREAIDDYIRAANKKPGQHLLPAVAAATELLRHGNMLGWSASGSPASGSTQACSAHIRYAEPRPHSFTAAPATCAQCN